MSFYFMERNISVTVMTVKAKVMSRKGGPVYIYRGHLLGIPQISSQSRCGSDPTLIPQRA